VGRCLIGRDGREGVALAARHRPEVALLDASNAGPFIASAVTDLRVAHAGIRIVLTSRCARQADRAAASIRGRRLPSP